MDSEDLKSALPDELLDRQFELRYQYWMEEHKTVPQSIDIAMLRLICHRWYKQGVIVGMNAAALIQDM